MGSCASDLSPEQKELKDRLDDRLKKHKGNATKVIKLLLLGAGECGKSTVLKQMKLLHGGGFTPDERLHYKELIWQNVVQSVQTLCQAMVDLEVPYQYPVNAEMASRILEQENFMPQPDDAETVTAIWNDTGIKAVMDRSREYHLLDSAPYFMDEVGRILAEAYEPSDTDILRCRLATTGIHCTKFKTGSDNQIFRMYDVGGQRGERKMWIHCFENVTAIFFIASLVEYDQVLAEDRTRNRLIESLALFDGVITLPWFKEAAVILFLNKDDLFREKIKSHPISPHFPEYLASNAGVQKGMENVDFDYEQGKKFIQGMYMNKGKSKLREGASEGGKAEEGEARNIFVHPTTATDTKNISFVWAATKTIIAEKSLGAMGFLS